MPFIERRFDDADGCDVEFHSAPITRDAELPVAVGGISRDADGPDADGCGVDFDEFEATPDDQLPETQGGVA